MGMLSTQSLGAWPATGPWLRDKARPQLVGAVMTRAATGLDGLRAMRV